MKTYITVNSSLLWFKPATIKFTKDFYAEPEKLQHLILNQLALEIRDERKRIEAKNAHETKAEDAVNAELIRMRA